MMGEKLGLMDFERAAKISGARFVVLKGSSGATRGALAQSMLDLHTQEFGYIEIVPPLLVRDDPAVRDRAAAEVRRGLVPHH